MERMIYLDNAATTMRKPPAVVDAVVRALTTFGGVGRGAHPASIAAGSAVYQARSAIAKMLGAPSPTRVAFTINATMALNIALQGLLPDGGRALTTAASHNSVLRPLFRARDMRGCAIDVAPIRPDGSLDFETYLKLLEREPAVVAATHASNLTGDIYDVSAMAQAAHRAGALFVLDAAQTAGAYPIDMAAIGADIVCFTGHKSLFGPQGTGGLAVASGVNVPPLLEGGSGIQSFDERQPTEMPESLEAGTLNAHGLAGLAAGIAFVQDECGGPAGVHRRVSAMAQEFEQRVAAIPSVHVYGRHAEADAGAVVALNVGEVDSAEVADALARDFNIATRAGAHCAPLMHKALGTERQGAVRFSFSALNTPDEVDKAVRALSTIAGDYLL